MKNYATSVVSASAFRVGQSVAMLCIAPLALSKAATTFIDAAVSSALEGAEVLEEKAQVKAASAEAFLRERHDAWRTERSLKKAERAKQREIADLQKKQAAAAAEQPTPSGPEPQPA
jgi:hypothetical protein